MIQLQQQQHCCYNYSHYYYLTTLSISFLQVDCIACHPPDNINTFNEKHSFFHDMTSVSPTTLPSQRDRRVVSFQMEEVLASDQTTPA